MPAIELRDCLLNFTVLIAPSISISPVMRTLFVVIIASLSIVGCTTSQTTVSNTLPYEVQQQINTSDEFETGFQFTPHPAGDEVEARFGTGNSVYTINNPVRGQFEELVRTKFGSIDETAENQIEVEITDIQTETDRQVHNLAMTMKVTVANDGDENTREFSYSTTIRPIDTGTEYTMGKRIPAEALEEFFLKFVVGADKFIDSTLGAEG